MCLKFVKGCIGIFISVFLFISCADNDNHSLRGDKKSKNTITASKHKGTNAVVGTVKVIEDREYNTGGYNGTYRLAKQHDCGLEIIISELRYKLETTERKESARKVKMYISDSKVH